jgi:hypothetical protein
MANSTKHLDRAVPRIGESWPCGACGEPFVLRNHHVRRQNYACGACCAQRNKEYRRRRFGPPKTTFKAFRGTTKERIDHFSCPEPNSGCWLWLGQVDRHGYGCISFRDKPSLAHRVSYEAYRGPIPAGLTLDHLCRVRCCVNPCHLEPVTPAVNTLRGNTIPARNKQKTHCIKGHPFNEKNTRVDSRGRRCCRACQVIATRQYKLRQAAMHEMVRQP